jgi:hypothetical protein
MFRKAVSILGGGIGEFTPFFVLRIPPPPIFSEAGEKFYIEQEGKNSTNLINSHFLIKIPPVFQILE